MDLTPKQWASKLESKYKDLDKVVILSISGVLSDYVPRIFEKGLNSSNRAIGSYSTKAIYVNPKTLLRKKFPTLGKTGRSSFKNGKPHKTGYFKGGYRDFKVTIGQGAKVNLRLNEELMSDMTTQKLVKTSTGYNYIVKKDINGKKLEGLEKRFGGKIFSLSRNENKQLIENVKSETIRLLNK